jgi:hypothetical protein
LADRVNIPSRINKESERIWQPLEAHLVKQAEIIGTLSERWSVIKEISSLSDNYR